MNYSKIFRNLTENLNFLCASIKKEISLLPTGEIKTYRRKKGENEYVDLILFDTGGLRKSVKKDRGLIAGIAERKYLEAELEKMKELAVLSKNAMSLAAKMEPKHLIEEIPSNLVPYLPERIVSPVKAHEATPNTANVFYSNERKHVTSDGTYVKSKSELIIYEKLLQQKVSFKYEAPLRIGDIDYYPDFTITLPDGVKYYWEHAGMMKVDKYRERHKRKMYIYEQAGIVPWKNLIVTYDDENETIDMRIIEAEIRNKLI